MKQRRKFLKSAIQILDFSPKVFKAEYRSVKTRNKRYNVSTVFRVDEKLIQTTVFSKQAANDAKSVGWKIEKIVNGHRISQKKERPVRYQKIYHISKTRPVLECIRTAIIV